MTDSPARLDPLAGHARILIVIPTLGKRVELLAETLDSITSQRGATADIVVVLPPNATEARELAHSAGAEVADDPGSLSGAINVGLGMRQPYHHYVNWIGDDDLLAPDALATAAQALDADSAASVAFGYCDYIDGDGQLLCRSRAGRFAPWLMTWGPNLVPQPGSLFRFTDVEAVGGLDTTLDYAMDLDLLLRLRRRGHFVNTGKTLSSFRWHAASTTVANRASSLAEAELVKRRYLSPRARFFAPVWERPVRGATHLAGRRVHKLAAKAQQDAI